MNIKVFRPKQYSDKLRRYKLLINGNVVAELKAGHQIEITIPEGSSILSAKVDWCSSNELSISEISPNDTVEVKNSFSHKLWIPFIPIYYITFGRKKYLSIKKSS